MVFRSQKHPLGCQPHNWAILGASCNLAACQEASKSNLFEHFFTVAYDMRDLSFRWKEDTRPIQMPQSLTLPQFQILGYKLRSCTKVYSTGGCIASDLLPLKAFCPGFSSL